MLIEDGGSVDTGSVMSAMATEPQAEPSANGRHSASALTPSVAAGSTRPLSAVERILSPREPVSTWTWSTTWQVLVPGTHTFTETKGRLTDGFVRPAGPAST